MTTGHTKETHKKTREGQRNNRDRYHHPKEKIAQLESIKNFVHGEILEVFAGAGNLTKWYQTKGNVTALTKETTGNSFDYVYNLRAEKKKFDFVDVDSYGYPSRLFPVVFELLKDNAGLVFTFPQIGVNCHNGIMQQHMSTFYGNPTPTIGDVVGVITDLALRDYQLASLLDVRKMDRVYRFAFSIRRVKATVLTNVRNRADYDPTKDSLYKKDRK